MNIGVFLTKSWTSHRAIVDVPAWETEVQMMAFGSDQIWRVLPQNTDETKEIPRTVSTAQLAGTLKCLSMLKCPSQFF
jgi:hypothetical protein